MEKLEKIKKFFLGLLTFICMIILILDLVLFSIKKTSEKYLKEEKINEIINNINVVDLFKDENGKELEQFTEIKNKFVDSGIPEESINEFINSEPINKYASDTVTKAIDNLIENKNEKIIDSNELNIFLEQNINNISKELQEKNVPKSEYLTKENQEKFINKIKEKTPDIEAKIEEINDKINEKLGFNYNEKLQKIFKILRLFYTKLIDIILIVIFVIFLMGIFITRQSIYKSLKWIGITFISSGTILYIINFIVSKLYKYIEKIPEGFNKFIKNSIEDALMVFNKYGLTYIIIGILLIIINIIIYYIKLKRENKKFEI